MLCSVCEQRLNQNGETDFTEQIFPNVYSDGGPVTSESDAVSYGVWFYSFCLGIIFRGLATERFAAVLNADEVYETFLICREHLKSLSAKLLKQQVQFTPCTANKVEVHFLINPVTVDASGDGMRLKQLETMLSTTGSPFLSTVRLQDGKASLSTMAHFFSAHFASCNVIVKFQPSVMAELPSWSLVDSNGGEYKVHEESRRWGHFPAGFWSAQLYATYKFEKVTLNYLTVHKNQRKSKLYSQKDETDKHKLIPGVPDSSEITTVFSSAKDTPTINHSFFSDFCNAPFVVNLLPNGYRVKTFGSGFVRSITPPHGHRFILHSTIVKNDEKSATVMLAFNANTVGIYLIGVFSGKKGQMIDLIDEESTEKIVVQQEAGALSLLKQETQIKMIEILPQVLKSKGVYSIQSVIQQVKCW